MGWVIVGLLSAALVFTMFLQIRDENRQKRGGGRLLGEAARAGTEDGAGGGFEAISGREPSPEFAALVAEEVRRRLAELRDESLRRVALLRLEGYDKGDIATLLGCSVRSVERKLRLIRDVWLPEDEP